jgi:hypothetical protein
MAQSYTRGASSDNPLAGRHPLQYSTHFDNVVGLAFGLAPICISAVNPAGQRLKLGMQHIHLCLPVPQLQCNPAVDTAYSSRVKRSINVY